MISGYECRVNGNWLDRRYRRVMLWMVNGASLGEGYTLDLI